MSYPSAAAYSQAKRALLGQRIRQLRQSQGMTQEKLAELAEMSLRDVARYELGEVTNPHLDKVLRLAWALEVGLNDLLEA